MKYFFIAFLISVCVIAYVWQNIEVMKMKIDYDKLVKFERDLGEKNDRIIAEIERLRSFKNIDGKATKLGLKRIKPENIFIIDVGESEGKDKNEGQ